MAPLTLKDVDDIINAAAKEGRLYHYNGGQAYIRLSLQGAALMIIDHTYSDMAVTVTDGTAYFAENAGNNIQFSKWLTDKPSRLASLHA